jgi:hypothetical protein
MAFPDLPLVVKEALAAEAMREHHHIWHAVRSRRVWDNLDPQAKQRLEEAGWRAPRFEQEAGAGLDFLGMHREMIAHANALLQHAADIAWPQVTAWDPIPWAANDSDWSMPALWDGADEDIRWAKDPQRIPQMQNLAARFRSENYLRNRSLDLLGTDIEFTLHGWMHLRWSARPVTELFDISVENDNLAWPWSSHVNKHFWKLHGWIDACIAEWERIHQEVADLSGAWSGPPTHIMTFDEAASLKAAARTAESASFRFDPAIAGRALRDE